MKNKFQFLAAVLSMALLSSCSSGSGDSKKTPAPQAENKTADLTDYSSCNGATPAGLSAINQWKSDYRVDQNLTGKLVFNIQSNTLEMTNQCSVPGLTAVARAVVAIQVTNNTIQILEDGKDEQTVTSQNADGSENKVTCRVSIVKALSNYAFQGSCLKLINPGSNSMLLILNQ